MLHGTVMDSQGLMADPHVVLAVDPIGAPGWLRQLLEESTQSLDAGFNLRNGDGIAEAQVSLALRPED